MTEKNGFDVGDSEAALLVSFYLSAATWGLALWVFFCHCGDLLSTFLTPNQTPQHKDKKNLLMLSETSRSS